MASISAFAILVLTLFITNSAQATLLFYEPFPNIYTNGVKLGTVGTAQSPSSNVWAFGNSASGSSPTVSSTAALTYAGLTTSNGSYGLILPIGSGKNAGAAIPSQTLSAGNSNLYASFLLKLNADPQTNRMVCYFRTSSASTPYAGVWINSANQLQVMKNSTTPAAPTTAVLSTNQTYLVVLRYKFNGTSSSDDEVGLWLNPAVGQANPPGAGTPDISTTSGGDNTTISVLWIAGITNEAANTPFLDEIRVATDWASVTPASCISPTVSNPANATTYEGLSTNFTSTVTGTDLSSPGNVPLKQWQVSTNSGTTWNNILNATNTSYTTNSLTLDANGNQFRIVASNACDSSTATSLAGTLTVLACNGAGVSVDPTNITVDLGTTASFNVTGSGSAPTYKWQVSTNNEATWDFVSTGSGGTTTTYTTPTVTTNLGGYKYRAIVSVACNSSSATSAVATLSYNCATVGIVSSPGSATTVEGSGATFSVTASGSLPTYQWQVSTNSGGTWNNIAGATTSSYTTNAVPVIASGNQFRCAISVACDNSTTNSAAATMTVRLGSETAFRSVATGNWSNPSTWEWSFDGATWSAALGYPTDANNTNILVRSPNVVTVAIPSLSIDQATVQAGGQITVNSGSTVTIAGSGTQLDVSGIVSSAGGAVVTNGTSAIVFENGGKFSWTAITAANIPIATWAANSTCEIAPTAAGVSVPLSNTLWQVFGNFKWNWPLQNGSAIIGGAASIAGFQGNLTNIQGDFEVASGSAFAFSQKPDLADTVVNVTVGGAIKVHTMTGNFSLGTGGTQLGTYTTKVGGGVIVDTTGKLDFGNPGTGVQVPLTLEFTGNSQYTLNGVAPGNAFWNSQFKVDAGAKLTLNSPISQTNSRLFTVDGTLDLNGITCTNLSRLAGASTGIITNSGAAVALTLGGAETNIPASVSYNGVIAGGNGNLSLIKSGPNMITLAGSVANTYAGGTMVNVGVLSVQKDGGLGAGDVTVADGATLQLSGGSANNYISDAAQLAINGSAAVELNYSGTPDTVKALVLDGVAQADGVWGSAASGAPNIAAQLIGTGTVKVQSTVVSNTPPVIGVVKVANGSVVINGSGTANGSYYVLTATNITLPLSNWTRLATNSIDGGGNFAFTNAIDPGQPKLFYRLQLP